MSDLDWLHLTRHDADRWTFDFTPELSRLDGKFYGGTGIAIATALIEAATGRGALWVATQFVSSADIGERFDCAVEVLASGRATAQVRVEARSGERLVFTAVGSAAAARPDALELAIPAMPDVPAPDDLDELRMPAHFEIPPGRPGWMAIAEFRNAGLVDGALRLWARMRDGSHSRATVAFLADAVPLGVAAATRRPGFGISLDNTVRFGSPPTDGWVLVDLDPHLLSGGYAHGAARLWSPDGRLVGVASQTASYRSLD